MPNVRCELVNKKCLIKSLKLDTQQSHQSVVMQVVMTTEPVINHLHISEKNTMCGNVEKNTTSTPCSKYS